MWQTESWRPFCLVLGLALGWGLSVWQTKRTAQEPEQWRRLALQSAECASALLGGLLCGILFPLAAPTSMLWAGFGALLGTVWAQYRQPPRHLGLAAACAWLSLCLPFTGALSCLAGWALGQYLGRPMWGLTLVPLFACPMAAVQFDAECCALTAAGAVVVAASRAAAFWPQRQAAH